MRRTLCVALLLSGLTAGFVLGGAPTAAVADGWRLAKRAEGVRVYTRAVDGSAYAAFRGVTSFKADFSDLLALIAETSSNCRWMYGCKRAVVLKQVSLTERYVYQVNAVPAPLWPRDMIVHSKARLNKAGDTVTIELTAAPHFCDGNRLAACRGRNRKAAAERFVRIERARGFYRLRRLPRGRVEVTWQMHAEPGGEIIGWLANLNLVDIPYRTLRGLKALISDRAARRPKLALALAERLVPNCCR